MIFKYAQHKDKRFPRVDKVKGVKRLRTIIFVILKYKVLIYISTLEILPSSEGFLFNYT